MGVHKIKTNMRGFQRWMNANKNKNLTGFFSMNGKDLKDREVRLAVNYAVRKGYKYDSDIPVEELERLFKQDEVVRELPTLF